MRRPWCPATRILEHRENEAKEREAEEQRKQEQKKLWGDDGNEKKEKPRLEDFPDIKPGDRVYMKNEGKWQFSLTESDDGTAYVLSVGVGRFLDTSLIKADVQPTFVRLLIKGRLFQYVLPEDISSDESTAQRSKITGELVITMPKVDPSKGLSGLLAKRSEVVATGQQLSARGATGLGDDELKKNKKEGEGIASVNIRGIVAQGNENDENVKGGGGGGGVPHLTEIRKAAVLIMKQDDEDDEDFVPDL